MAAAQALAEVSPSRKQANANLLPPVTQLREVSCHVAVAVARAAHAEGLADATEGDELEARVRGKLWTPRYLPYRRAA
jgi:malate dehydrogenase (oxaloacetate-decarboxylating)